MKRFFLYISTLVAVGVLVTVLAPESAWIAIPSLVLVATVLMAWGVVSLRSGLWYNARWRAQGSPMRVALTYDDGPDGEATSALLDLLRERGVSATFFCVGERVHAEPGLVARLHEAGHMIGNHSQRHSRWTNLYSTARLRSELELCQAEIQAATGVRPRYYRPPFGLANHAIAPACRAVGLEIIGWQCRGLDLPGSDPTRAAERILNRVRPGGVILLHDGGRKPEAVMETTRRVLDGLDQRGLEVVPLDELLAE